MGKCWKCETELTLKEEETRCDSCGEIINYCCHNCKQWFLIGNEKGKKLKECKVCGFFVCPNCGVCGISCKKNEWCGKIRRILEPEVTHATVENFTKKLKEIIAYIEQIKVGKERKLCPNNVPISYAKTRIKSCICKTQGYRVKNIGDKEKFSERLQKVMEIPDEKELTVEEFRESGSYGQEWRDILNTSICYGWIKVIYKKNKQGDEYALFKKVPESEEKICQYLDAQDLFVKFCKKCKRIFSKEKEFCDKCIYIKDTTKHKKGERYLLQLKISNKDVCKLPRGEFTTKEVKEDDKNS